MLQYISFFQIKCFRFCPPNRLAQKQRPKKIPAKEKSRPRKKTLIPCKTQFGVFFANKAQIAPFGYCF